jgi:hypothetical protein
MNAALLETHRRLRAMLNHNLAEATSAEAQGRHSMAGIYQGHAAGNRQCLEILEEEMRAAGMEVPA